MMLGAQPRTVRVQPHILRDIATHYGLEPTVTGTRRWVDVDGVRWMAVAGEEAAG